MSSPLPSVAQAGQLSDGLSSLVLSKKYLQGARPPHLFKLERGDVGGDAINYRAVDDYCYGGDWQPTTAWVQVPRLSAAANSSAVQARYEPSDVFTPLVFEETFETAQHSAAAASSTVLLQTIRRPLQHLPPPAQSATQKRPAANKPSAVAAAEPLRPQRDSRAGGKCTAAPLHHQPGDLSWLVNFQVASIFESALDDGPAGAGPQESAETQRQKKRVAVKTEPKSERGTLFSLYNPNDR